MGSANHLPGRSRRTAQRRPAAARAGRSAPSAPAATLAERATTTLSDVTIFSPPSNAGWVDPRVLYARASTDKGQTWTEVGAVRDTENGWGLRYQPTLFELPQAVGAFPAGTVLAAGNSIPTDLSQTKIDVYASTDGGATWTFASSVASGGEARPNNGLTPVWEPMFIATPNTAKSSCTKPRPTSRPGPPLVDDVRDDANYAARPGMPAVAPLPDGRYIYAYEQCGTDGCRVHYRLPQSPVDVLSAPSYSLQSTRGTRPTSSPYVVVWNNDTVVLSAGSGSQLFVNRKLGAPDAWVEYATPQPAAYSRGLALLGKADPDALMLIGAGGLPPSTTNRVSVSVIDLRATLGQSPSSSGGAAAAANSNSNSNSNSILNSNDIIGSGDGQAAASNGAAVSSGGVRRRHLPPWRRNY
ncbi:hypothetical protein PG997_006780 [Apiospora hydei]|uniref:Uncharacterized protein n=1 Tax=Apiospora hydei TaxID=1337664 RepID=A0ABR1WPP7_9PEZI